MWALMGRWEEKQGDITSLHLGALSNPTGQASPCPTFLLRPEPRRPAGTCREGKGLESKEHQPGGWSLTPRGPRDPPLLGPGRGAWGPPNTEASKTLCRVALWVLSSFCTLRGSTTVPLGGHPASGRRMVLQASTGLCRRLEAALHHDPGLLAGRRCSGPAARPGRAWRSGRLAGPERASGAKLQQSGVSDVGAAEVEPGPQSLSRGQAWL